MTQPVSFPFTTHKHTYTHTHTHTSQQVAEPGGRQPCAEVAVQQEGELGEEWEPAVGQQFPNLATAQAQIQLWAKGKGFVVHKQANTLYCRKASGQLSQKQVQQSSQVPEDKRRQTKVRYGQLLGQCKVLIDEAIKNNKYKDTMAGLKTLMAKVQQDEPVVPIVRNPAVKRGQGSGRSKKKAKHSP